MPFLGGVFARLGSRRSQAGFTCFAVGVGVLAGLYHGVPTADIDLNDGGVWVTSADDRAIAHLNYPSMTLDGVVIATAASFDVAQSENHVVLEDLQQETATPVDTHLMALGNSAEMVGLNLTVGGATAVVSDSARGEVWVLPASAIASFSPEAPPLLTKAKGVVSTVGRDGTAYAVDAAGQVTSFGREGKAYVARKRGEIGDLTEGEFDVTVVGSVPAVLDRAAKQLKTTDSTVDLPEADTFVLQPPGDGADSAAVATEKNLLLAPISGGNVKVAEGSPTSAGDPAAPVRVGDCWYGAWGGTGHYQRACDSAGANMSGTDERVSSASAAGDLVFRVNRDVVVLNNVQNGDSFLINENMALVANWDELLGQLEDQRKKRDEEKDVETRTLPNRSEKNHPPTARDDKYGVRPGRSTSLPVLDNDSDPDGDVLLAQTDAEIGLGTLQRVRGGEELQVSVPEENSRGAESFKYEAHDGRGKPGRADVRIEIHPWTENGPPEKKDKQVVVALGHQAEVKYNLLQDWIDPDGDPIYLKKVQGTKEIAATSTEDGTVTLRDLGRGKPGRKQIAVWLSDGRETSKGTLDVDLQGKGNVDPVANADHVTIVVGQTVVVDPLANDTDANGDTLRLSNLQPPKSQGLKVKPDFSASTFSVTGEQAGTYYVEYVITDGPSTAKGLVRLEVIDPPSGNVAPVADNDLALMRPGESVLVDVLSNDYDPAGGVLVVQSVQADRDARLTLDIVNHELVRVRSQGSLRGPIDFSYTVSNGLGSATAQVTVVPIPPVSSDVAPIAEDDKATVRAGDIVTIPVMKNDHSPAGLKLRLGPQVAKLPKDFPGSAFVSGEDVRFKAGNKAGRVRLTYTVFDSRDNFASAEVLIDVTPKDGPNSPPTPPPLVARVLAGGEVIIPVPTDNIDPDGDSVALLGIGSAPSKGVVTVSGGSLRYEAPATASGTDRFKYVVQDAFGATSSASVSVGIAPPTAQNQLPTAMPDVVTVRPGRKISVPVTANDTDPDGDIPLLKADSVKPADKQTSTKASTKGATVELSTPDAGAQDLKYTYEISDHPGGVPVQGVLTVRIRPNAPLLPPIARDDVVTSAEVLGRNSVDVDVLANDEDPDGSVDDLEISVHGQGVSIEKGKVVTQLTARRRVVLYTITDQDGLESSAIIAVPGTGDVRPVIDPSKVPLSVEAGSTLGIPLDKVVIVRDGHEPSLTFGNTVTTSGGGSAKASDQRTVSFTAGASYVGLTAVSFEVTDGKNADDPKGLKAVLSVPVEVTPHGGAGNTPPSCTPTALGVAPGETTKVNLRAMCTDSDGDGLNFRLMETTGAAAGAVKVALSGSNATVAAGSSAKVGSRVLASVAASDGSSTPVRFTIPIDVTTSGRPLISISPISIDDAEIGKASTVDVAKHATNPFAAEGKSLALTGARKVGGDADGKVSLHGTNISVTPLTHGQMVVEFTLEDASGDPARAVTSTLAVTVRGAPDAPSNVRALSAESETATVTWSPGATNGDPIEHFDVYWRDGGHRECGQVTKCTITGLTNQVDYTFTVTATNSVDESEKSSPSNVVKPDRKPDAPVMKSAVFGDQSADVTWTEPRGDFSAVTRYTLEISPAAASGARQKDVNGTSFTWQGLKNGTSYRFRVQAHNEAPDPSDWSASSAEVVPAGVPRQPAAPTVQKQPADGTQPSATVSWQAPDGNGDDNMTYELRASNGRAWKTSGTSQQVQMNSSDQDITFKVQATNKAGDSDWSPDSAAQRFFQKPGPVGNLKAQETGSNNRVKITFASSSGNGAKPSEITYHWKANGIEGTLPSGGSTITNSSAFPNGKSVSVSVWAVSNVRGETSPGDPRTDSANAYGPPTAPSVTASGGYRSVKFTWNGSSTGNGRSVTGLRYRINGGSWRSGSVSDTYTHDTGAGSTVRIEVQTRNAAGYGSSGTGSAKAWPASTYQFTKSSRKDRTGRYPTWNEVDLTLRDWKPNSHVYCWSGGINAPDWSSTFTVNSGGDWGKGWTGSGTGPGAVVGSGINMNNYGSCRQQ